MDRRNTMKYFFIVVACFLGIVVFLISYREHLREGGRPTPERSAAGRIAVIVQHFIGENQGRWPTNWNELTLSLDLDNRRLLEKGKEVVPAIYVFTPTNLFKSDFREGRVIVASYKPVNGGGRKGRYVIFERPDKEIWTDWMNEAEFQKMLKQSGVTLPAPDPAAIQAAREAVEKAYPTPIEVPPIVVVALFVIGVGFVTFRLLRRGRVNSK